jgi:amidase
MDAVEDAGVVLRKVCGHEVESAWPDALDEAELIEHFFTIMTTGVAYDIANLAKIAGREIGPDDVEPLTWEHYQVGRAHTAAAYVAAVEALRAWTRRMARWWKPDAGGFDLLLTPTMASPPATIGEVRGDDPLVALTSAVPYAAFTLPFNITGQPAISVPLGWTDGLPIGVQLVAAAGREDLLLRVAAQLEAVRPWAGRRPPISASGSQAAMPL